MRLDDTPTRTIRLVSDVPDFGALYRDSPLTPRMAARLWAIAEIIYDDAVNGAAGELVDQLPRNARFHADEMFVTAFVSRFAVIAKRLAAGLECLESITTCTADEMALHFIFSYAEEVYDGHDPEWIELLPGRPDEDYDFGWLPELLLRDTDVLLLYNPALDGIDDPEAGDRQQWRLINLHPGDWFTPFLD